MATARSAERPGTATGRSRSGCGGGCGSASGSGSGSGSSPPEDDVTKCPVCEEAEPGGSPPCGHPVGPRCLSRRPDERLRRRGDPDRSSSRAARRDSDGRREVFVCPALFTKSADVSLGAGGKHKLLCEDRDETRRRKDESVQRDDIGVLSDSENEEPIRRIRNVSAFVRKTKSSSAVTGGAQRSRSCTDPVEAGGGKLKVSAQPAPSEQVGISHSFTAGILLSSENSRSVSAPLAAPDRRLAWRAVVTSSSSAPLVLPPPRPERSISPESNDSISEELNHFKPIVCSPCTPPKRLPDGRLLEPTIVKSTPRNLTRGLQRSTSYEASPAVLQKWRQIELDRQNLKVNSKGTLTSPIAEVHHKTGAATEDAIKTHAAPAGDGLTSTNKRRLLFDPGAGDTDAFHKQTVKIRVPAIRYSADASFRRSSDSEPTAVMVPESCSQGALFSQKQSFSPYVKNSGFQSCVFVPKDSQSPRKESDSSFHSQTTSRRGRKRKQKTKHLDSERDSDLRRSRSVAQDAFDQRYIRQVQQDRVLALKLQRQFDLENQSANRRRSPDTYFLRSWMSNQNRRRRGLRRSRRINKKH